MLRVSVKALKDDAKVLGLVLMKGNMHEIDIDPSQVDAVSAAVKSGDIEAFGLPTPAPAKPAEVAADKPKGKG